MEENKIFVDLTEGGNEANTRKASKRKMIIENKKYLTRKVGAGNLGALVMVSIRAFSSFPTHWDLPWITTWGVKMVSSPRAST